MKDKICNPIKNVLYIKKIFKYNKDIGEYCKRQSGMVLKNTYTCLYNKKRSYSSKYDKTLSERRKF